MDTAFEPPRDDVEAKIAAVFEKILSYGPAGRGDDFFLSGGDLLTVMELNIHLANLFHDSDRVARASCLISPVRMPLFPPTGTSLRD